MGLVSAALARLMAAGGSRALSGFLFVAPLACRGVLDEAPAASKAAPLAAARTAAANQLGSALLVNASAVVPGEESTATLPEPWVLALRVDDFAAAERAFALLPPLPAPRAELRFARARARLQLADYAGCIALLTDLEPELPELSARVSELRAQAQAEVGPFSAAAKFFETRGAALDLVRAAAAYAKGGSPAEALRVSALGLSRLGKKGPRSSERPLRQARAGAAETLGKLALAAADYRFLALEEAGSEEGENAALSLRALDPKLGLGPTERLQRARALARAGKIDPLATELTRLAAEKVRVKPGLFASLRAEALFNARSDYREAAELFTRAAAQGSEDRARDSFYAAKSLARAQDDAAAEAAYQKLIRQMPSSSWAEQAELAVARLHFSSGSFERAASAYASYLARRGKRGAFIAEASYERAVALLAVPRYAEARAVLARLEQSSRDPRFVSRVRELGAVAELGAGSRERALVGFRGVIADYPLTFAALAAAARLRALGEAVPPALTPPAAGATPLPLALELPPEVRLLHRLGLEREAESALRPFESRFQSAHAPRSGESLCEVYGLLSVAGRRYQLGQKGASRLGLDHAPGPRSRWMWDCVYPRPYAEVVEAAELAAPLPRGLLWSVMRQESGFRPGVRSAVGAAGLLQLMPNTALRVAAELGEADPREQLLHAATSIRLGAAYLAKLLKTFQGNPALALAAYNAGPAAAQRFHQSAAALPLDVWVARIPYGETRGYVERVLGNWARYSYLAGGESAVPVLPLSLPVPAPLLADAY